MTVASRPSAESFRRESLRRRIGNRANESGTCAACRRVVRRSLAALTVCLLSVPLADVAAQATAGLSVRVATLDVDAGRLVLEGHGLTGAVVRVGVDDTVHEEACGDDDARCEVPTPRDLRAAPERITASVMAAPSSTAPQPLLVLRALRLVVDSPFVGHPVLDLANGSTRLRVTHPEALADVECGALDCMLDDGQVLVNAGASMDESVTLVASLRPRISFRDGTTIARVMAQVVRCSVDLVSGAPFRDVSSQRIVIATSAACASGDVGVRMLGRDAEIEQTRPDDGRTFLVLRLDRIDETFATLALTHAGALVGTRRIETQEAPRPVASLVLDGIGPIEVVPTNRDVRLTVASPSADLLLAPEPVAGVYAVSSDDEGWLVRGESAARGGFSLRFVVRTRRPELTWLEEPLTRVSEAVARTLRPVNVAIDLGESTAGDAPIVEMLCGDGHGHPTRLPPGVTSSIPFGSRDTCHLVVHRDRLNTEDGTQALTLEVRVTSLNGEPRDEDHALRIGAADEDLVVHVSGIEHDFDRAVVELTIDDDSDHYAAPALSSVAWTVIFGNSPLRLYATAAIPTGLFRIGDTDTTGVLPLNAGAILRLAWLSREGREFPLGFELGVMWLGIGTASSTGSTGSAAHDAWGSVAVVGGLGLAVPLANASSETQTAVNLHAWFEWDVSRTVEGPAGLPLAFIFGPSFSLGDVGVDF